MSDNLFALLNALIDITEVIIVVKEVIIVVKEVIIVITASAIFETQTVLRDFSKIDNHYILFKYMNRTAI